MGKIILIFFYYSRYNEHARHCVDQSNYETKSYSVMLIIAFLFTFEIQTYEISIYLTSFF